MTSETDSLKKRLLASGMDPQRVNKIEAMRDRLNIPDNDPAMMLLLEFEAYLKAFEHIPKAIEAAQQSAIDSSKAQCESSMHEVLINISQHWEKTQKALTENSVNSAIKQHAYTTLMWCVVMLCFVSAISMGLYALLSGTLPPYITDGHITGFVVIDWVMGCLNAPIWLVLVSVAGSAIVTRALKRQLDA